MRGSDYVAVRRISNAADETLAAVGDTCELVPEEALAHLEWKGAIRLVTPELNKPDARDHPTIPHEIPVAPRPERRRRTAKPAGK